jgi:hypothetical protein
VERRACQAQVALPIRHKNSSHHEIRNGQAVEGYDSHKACAIIIAHRSDRSACRMDQAHSFAKYFYGYHWGTIHPFSDAKWILSHCAFGLNMYLELTD